LPSTATFNLVFCLTDRILISVVKSTRCNKFILFWNGTLRVSDGLSVHHQEFKTVRTATGICQTDTAVCLLAGMLLDLTTRTIFG